MTKRNITLKKLIDMVEKEIINNVEHGDTTAFFDLLKKVPVNDLLAFLPETKSVKVQCNPPDLNPINNMVVTHCQIIPDSTYPKTKALARITINDSLQLTKLRVIDGRNGLFVGFPIDSTDKSDDYKAFFYPLTKELREHIEKVVLEKYQEFVDNQ